MYTEKNDYKNLINLCFNVCSFFSFTKYRGRLDKNDMIAHKNLLDKLKNFYIKTIFAKHWFCYYTNEKAPLEIYVFKADEEAKDIILNDSNNLFLRDNNTLNENLRKGPEDICFFIENRLFLGTVSHEEICFAFPPSDDIYNKIMVTGDWNISNRFYDDMKEQINLNNLEGIIKNN